MTPKNDPCYSTAYPWGTRYAWEIGTRVMWVDALHDGKKRYWINWQEHTHCLNVETRSIFRRLIGAENDPTNLGLRNDAGRTLEPSNV